MLLFLNRCFHQLSSAAHNSLPPISFVASSNKCFCCLLVSQASIVTECLCFEALSTVLAWECMSTRVFFSALTQHHILLVEVLTNSGGHVDTAAPLCVCTCLYHSMIKNQRKVKIWVNIVLVDVSNKRPKDQLTTTSH